MQRLLKIAAGLVLGAVVLCAFAPAETRLVGAALAAVLEPVPGPFVSPQGGRP